MFLIVALALGFLLLRSQSAQASGAAGSTIPPADLAEIPVADLQAIQTGDLAAANNSQQTISEQNRLIGSLGTTAAAGATSATAIWVSTTWAGPVGAAVGAAVALFIALRGTAHIVARNWTDHYQDPWGKALSAIVDPHDRAMANGTETPDAAQADIDAVVFLWAQYQVHAEEFAQRGADYRKVIDQSYQTLNGPNGLPGFPLGFVNTVIQNLRNDLDTLNGFSVPVGISGGLL